ncbi:MAG: 1-deoxy-D-xylulose-5-phosphate reductoisomerase [Clostridia bacterium]|nr:1-deoxy-D-xylulose-5-phosphate reductoisomerase [Clostridia bacterium]
MTKNISLLGSTGSIGVQTLDVAEMHDIRVSALAANRNVKLIEEQARKFQPDMVAMLDHEAALSLKAALSDTDINVYEGESGIKAAAEYEKADTVVNAIVGVAGLLPTLSAIKAGKNIALANKETLVAGGSIVNAAIKQYGVKIYPVDSEHSAVFQCLECSGGRYVKKIILTASGGSFFGKTRKELENVTVEQALNHPNWSMGKKITIDSATMMNKGLEVIEASWLFGVPDDKIDVLIHQQSIIHSMVQFDDNAVIAQLGTADMRIPIQYALTYPDRIPSPAQELDLTDIANLTFAKPDYDTFECLAICREALRKGGLYPAVANAANEAAVQLFLDGKIGFLQIGEIVGKAVADFKGGSDSITLEDIIEADKETRKKILI